MARIFITGSADGLGKMAAELLIKEGHKVVMHARSEGRAEEVAAEVTGVETFVTGDLSTIAETLNVAKQVNALGHFDAFIHNAAIGHRESGLVRTVDGLSQLFAINSLAPYILTALIDKPGRLIYTSSGLHRGGDSSLKDLQWQERPWNGFEAYSDSKLHNTILAFAVARKWPNVYSNAVEPGWVATKMGGKDAPDSLEEGPKTQAWLAVSDEPAALVSGQFFYHQQQREFNPAVNNVEVQEKFLAVCQSVSGIRFPS